MDFKMVQFNDGDLEISIHKVVNSFNTTIYTLANEPSLGMYRIQEHISSAVPRLVGQKQTLELVNKQVEGACFDVEYDNIAVCDMRKSIQAFQSMKKSLQRAIETKEKMDEAAARSNSAIQSSQGLESYPPPHRRSYGATAKTTAIPIKAQVPRPELANSEQQKSRTQGTNADLYLKPKTFT